MDGDAIELGVGVKLKWDIQGIPLQVSGRFGGAVDLLLLGSDFVGVSAGFRGGAGVKWFFFPTFGVGPEVLLTVGPSFITENDSVEFYGAIDLYLISVEYRF